VLSKLFEGLYLKVFVNIVVFRSKSVVYIELCNKNRVIKSVEDTFDTTTINAKMYNFIHTYVNESPYFYISILDTSLAQGAVATCKSREIVDFFDVSSSKHLCYADRWTYYTSSIDLHTLQKVYGRIGLDFVFSPFVLLARFFKDKIDTHMSMYLLIEESFISLSVFDHSELLFSEHLDLNHAKDKDDLSMDDDSMQDFDLESSVNLDDINIEDDADIGELDDFGDIEDLDSFDDMDDFSDIKEEDEEDYIKDDNEYSGNDSEGFNEDYQRFSLIKSSVNRFYKDDKFQSKFIESVFIADGVVVSSDLKRYLEDEMFLNVFVRRIDLPSEVCALAKAELE